MIAYSTSILHLPETRSGLLPDCWKVEHLCSHCHHRVEPDQLIKHARQHEAEVVVAN